MNVIADATDNAMKSQNRSTIITRTAEANSPVAYASKQFLWFYYQQKSDTRTE